jgi:hypothetical protein
MVSQFNSNMNRTMTEDQFCQVVDAILNGKYSWACLLILQFSGYNPLHYIPYRTYNRLMKEHNYGQKNSRNKRDRQKPLDLENLPHLHTLDDASHQVKGGSGLRHFFFSIYSRNHNVNY